MGSVISFVISLILAGLFVLFFITGQFPPDSELTDFEQAVKSGISLIAYMVSMIFLEMPTEKY